MRADPSFSPPPVDPQSDPDRVTLVLRYELLTPLFGGGVVPGKADPITTVRASEVRGHLRFWWRATRGGQYVTLAELKEAEAALWGAASTETKAYPSKVQVVVQCDQPGTLDHPFEFVEKNGELKLRPRRNSIVPPYVAFPLQPPKELWEDRPEIQPVRVGVAFTLTLTYPKDAEKDMEATLWAWETFGGIGARTRRGFGAVHRVREGIALPKRDTLIHETKQKLHQITSNNPMLPDVPLLSARFKATSTKRSAIEAWQHLVKKLKNFRQPRKGQWPEKKSVRAILEPSDTSSSEAIFPRAQFGLPIVFDTEHLSPDLESLVLVGKTAERLASPLILRPIKCQDGAVGIALLLAISLSEEGKQALYPLQLRGDHDALPAEVTADLTLKQAQKIPVLKQKRDVLQAFLDSI